MLTLLAGGLVAWGCTLPDDTISEPDPLPEGPATVVAPPAPGPGPAGPATAPVLGSPGAAPTPAPETEDGEPEPEPTDDPDTPPAGSGCGEPPPPPISRMKVKVHVRGENSWTLDSTPLVGPDAAYCAEIGFTDGRENCPVRPEGHPERIPCEAWAVGTAQDTGRPGPTWRRNDGFCTGPASGCQNHDENQYLLKAYFSGDYNACTRDGVCGELFVDR